MHPLSILAVKRSLCLADLNLTQREIQGLLIFLATPSPPFPCPKFYGYAAHHKVTQQPMIALVM